MKKILLLLLFCPSLVSGQTNTLYKLLNWNSQQQQKGLIAWYDLQDPSSVQLIDNQKVYMLKDKSSWNNHIIQNNSLSQPLYISDNNMYTNVSSNGISFANGGYMSLKFPTTKPVNAITSFIVCKNEIGGSKLLFDLSNEGGEGVASCYSGLYRIDSRVPNSSAQFDPDYTNNPNKIIFISTKGRSGQISSYFNDLHYFGIGSTNFQGNTYDRIRLSTPYGDAPTDGTLYELILFDYELSDNDFMIVKNYLQNKYFSNSTSDHNINSSQPNMAARTAFIEGREIKSNPIKNNAKEDSNGLANFFADIMLGNIVIPNKNKSKTSSSRTSYEKPRYGDVSTNNYSVVTNAWQCSICGELSRNPNRPEGGKFGRCDNNKEHYWRDANTTTGFQCTTCGITSFILNRGRADTKPCCGEFGRCKKNLSQDHYWRKF
jgi:hypothetical protein